MLHTPITEDPRATAAVADFTATVVEIRQRSARWFAAPADSDARAEEQTAIDDLVGAMQARCDRIDLSLDALFALINAELVGRRDNVARPHGDYLFSLVEENNRAYAAERQLKAEVSRYQALLEQAAAARVAADRACAGFMAGWAIRGQR